MISELNIGLTIFNFLNKNKGIKTSELTLPSAEINSY